MDPSPLRDSFSAEGFEGQFILIVPSKDLIVVRLGYTNEPQLRTGEIRRWMGRVARTFGAAPASNLAPVQVRDVTTSGSVEIPSASTDAQ